MHVKLYEDIARHGRIATTYAYPVKVEGRYVMDPSPTPKFDNPKMHMSPALQLFGAGREKRIYAMPPFTEVVSLDFEDHPFEVQSIRRALRAVRGRERLSRRGHPRRPRRPHVRLLRHRPLRDAPGRRLGGRCRAADGWRVETAVLRPPSIREAAPRPPGLAGHPPRRGRAGVHRPRTLNDRRTSAARQRRLQILRRPRRLRERQLRPVAGRGAGGGRRIRLRQDDAAQLPVDAAAADLGHGQLPHARRRLPRSLPR